MKNSAMTRFIAQNFNLADEEDFGSFQEWEVKEDRQVLAFGTPILYAVKRGWDVELYSEDAEIVFSGEVDSSPQEFDAEVLGA